MCEKNEGKRDIQRLEELRKKNQAKIDKDAEHIQRARSGEDILKKACKTAKEYRARAEDQLKESQQAYDLL